MPQRLHPADVLYPGVKPFPLLAASSLFHTAAALAGPEAAVLANAYPPRYFEAVAARDRWPSIARACRSAGGRLRVLEDLRNAEALSADVTGAGLRESAVTDAGRLTMEDSNRAVGRQPVAQCLR